MQYCSKCGNKITDKFCPKCGNNCEENNTTEITQKLYTLRAGLSTLSIMMEDSDKEVLELYEKSTSYSSKESEVKDKIWHCEYVIKGLNKIFNKPDDYELTYEEAKTLAEGYWKSFKVHTTIGSCAIIGTLVFGFATFLSVFAVNIFNFSPGIVLAMLLLTIVCKIIDHFCEKNQPSYLNPDDIEGMAELPALKEQLAFWTNMYQLAKDERGDKEEEVKTIGNAIFNSLKKQFGSFLHVKDWGKIDLIIFYFESGRATTMKEALELLDRQKQTDQIVEAIERATERICNTIEEGFLHIEDTIIQCSTILSAQLSQISSIQQQMLITAESMNEALRLRADYSSEELMEDVHTIRHYTECDAIERRNS